MSAAIENVADVAALRVRGILAFQKLPEAENGVEGCSQLMAHSREELAFRPVRPVSLLLRLPQCRFRAFPLGDVFDHHEEVTGRAVLVADDAGGASGPKQLAVLADVALLDAGAF